MCLCNYASHNKHVSDMQTILKAVVVVVVRTEPTAHPGHMTYTHTPKRMLQPTTLLIPCGYTELTILKGVTRGALYFSKD